MDVNNKMDIDVGDKRKSNFSSLGHLSGSNGIGRGNSSSTKGDIKKLVIKNFKSKSLNMIFFSGTKSHIIFCHYL